MIFLNAGVGLPGALKDVTFEDVQSQIAVNTLGVIYTAKVLLDKQLKRVKRSALVITSSIAANNAGPGMIPYKSSKVFVDYLGKGLNYELSEKIDVMSW